MTDLLRLTAANGHRWANMRVHPEKRAEIAEVAKRLVEGKPHYTPIAAKTGVPWAEIAVIHEREGSGKWTVNIAQGDPWDQRSVHVPAGRGPFQSFGDAAYDALVRCAPYAAKWRDWSPGGALTLLERYNGLGYADRGVPSPYIWAGTDQYVAGKYVADGKYDATAVDQQLGCAALIAGMMAIDPSIEFAPVAAPPSPLPSKPVIVATGAGAGAAAAAHHHLFDGLFSYLTWSHIMSFPVMLDFGLAAVVIYFIVDAVQSYAGATGTAAQRIFSAGKSSATILWARFTALVTGLTGGIVWMADMLNAPGVGTAVQGALKPQYVAFFTIAMAVITELCRRRTLVSPAAPTPPAPPSS